jgi:hypothetical protein
MNVFVQNASKCTRCMVVLMWVAVVRCGLCVDVRRASCWPVRGSGSNRDRTGPPCSTEVDADASEFSPNPVSHPPAMPPAAALAAAFAVLSSATTAINSVIEQAVPAGDGRRYGRRWRHESWSVESHSICNARELLWMEFLPESAVFAAHPLHREFVPRFMLILRRQSGKCTSSQVS